MLGDNENEMTSYAYNANKIMRKNFEKKNL